MRCAWLDQKMDGYGHSTSSRTMWTYIVFLIGTRSQQFPPVCTICWLTIVVMMYWLRMFLFLVDCTMTWGAITSPNEEVLRNFDTNLDPKGEAGSATSK